MNASDSVIEKLMKYYAANEIAEFQNLAKRYSKDPQLTRILQKQADTDSPDETLLRLKNLYASRKIKGGGGTNISLADRRELGRTKKEERGN